MHGSSKKAVTDVNAASKNNQSVYFTWKGVLPLHHLPTQNQSLVLTAKALLQT